MTHPADGSTHASARAQDAEAKSSRRPATARRRLRWFLLACAVAAGGVLIDQGASDQFLDLLKPETLAEAMMKRRQPGQFRMQPGFDHSYWFVQSFIADHVFWHAERLG